jgi:beta-phosphoglucomutase-like phosphatase (HAD superfamily)
MKKITDKNNAAELLRTLSDEFAVVKNPEYIHPEFELYPLAPKLTGPLSSLAAAVMDMDGTTTTTEELCIHSLEYMLRVMSGKLSAAEWSGLDHTIDYPNIIGNSTTKHVEYLITKYHPLLNDDRIKEAYFFAAVWTLLEGKDEKRKQEVTVNLTNLNLSHIFDDGFYQDLAAKGTSLKGSERQISEYFHQRFSDRFPSISRTDVVKIGIDIYYQRYHEILQRIKRGESKQVSAELFNDPNKHLIQPMPGILFFLSLVKGWLGEEAGVFAERLQDEFDAKTGSSQLRTSTDAVAQQLQKLSAHFTVHPAKVAIVTSSIFYEADIVMGEVFQVLTEQLRSIPLSAERKSFIMKQLSRYRNVYDAFITASDSTEIRLKPHRDLYSIALHQLNIPVSEFGNVIGFEDSESGTIAIRAAGIGRCIAVPFAQTKGHNFEAATVISHGGVPEVVLTHNIFFAL